MAYLAANQVKSQRFETSILKGSPARSFVKTRGKAPHGHWDGNQEDYGHIATLKIAACRS